MCALRWHRKHRDPFSLALLPAAGADIAGAAVAAPSGETWVTATTAVPAPPKAAKGPVPARARAPVPRTPAGPLCPWLAPLRRETREGEAGHQRSDRGVTPLGAFRCTGLQPCCCSARQAGPPPRHTVKSADLRPNQPRHRLSMTAGPRGDKSTSSLRRFHRETCGRGGLGSHRGTLTGLPAATDRGRATNGLEARVHFKRDHIF